MKYDSLFALLEAYPDEETCIAHLEKLRWPKGIVCPLCGSTRRIYKVERSHIYKCADCRKQFSVRKGTIFEESRLPLRKWFAAFWLVTSNRKGIASTQLSREIGVTQKTAWFMLGRMREVAEAMGVIGGPIEGTVEVDETFVGGKEGNKHESKKLHAGTGTVGKQAVMGVRQREGRVATALIPSTSRVDLHKFIRDNISPASTIYTDDHKGYLGLTEYCHESINHTAGEYVRGDCHTNGIESFWSLLKRAHYGIFHKISGKHLHRYLAEFEARWSMNDLDGLERVDTMLESTPGLRLTYRSLIA